MKTPLTPKMLNERALSELESDYIYSISLKSISQIIGHGSVRRLLDPQKRTALGNTCTVELENTVPRSVVCIELRYTYLSLKKVQSMEQCEL